MSDLATTAQDEREHLYALVNDPGGLRFCGCGSPEEAYDLVRDVLALAPFYDHPEAVRDLIGPRAYQFVLYQIDEAGLIEHGGTVGGAWLSAKGKHYLPLMQRYGWDDLEDDCGFSIIPVGFPHDGKGCAEVKCSHWLACQG
jgi:hypothetical protein